MKKRGMAAVCMAAVLALAGCGAGSEPDSGPDVGIIQNAADDDAARVEPADAAGTDMEEQNGNDSGQDMGDDTQKQDENGAQQKEQSVEEEHEGLPKGKTFSILGDSISTFRGYNLEGYAVFFPDFGEVTVVEDTWWQRVADDLGLTLYQNGSSSGATVVGDSTGTTDPACACNELRTSALAGEGGVCPEIIIVYLGTNDMAKAVPIGTNDGTEIVEEGEITTFSDAYTLMLDKLLAKYPLAEIYCCTLLPIGFSGTETPYIEWVNSIELTAADYSRTIVQIAEHKGLSVIDLQNCGITIDNLAQMTTDGVHPKPEGMACIAGAVKRTLTAN